MDSTFADLNVRFLYVIYRDVQNLVTSRDSSGSLLKYDPATKRTTVLLRGLPMAVGLAVSRDGYFALVSEYLANRVRGFWVRGPKANTSETSLVLPEKPHGIRRNARGEFWIVANNVLGRPPATTQLALKPVGQRVNEHGQVLQVMCHLLEGLELKQ